MVLTRGPGRRSSRSRARAACSRPSTGSGSTGSCRCSARCCRAARPTRTCRRACGGSRAGGAGGRASGGRLRGCPLPILRRRHRRPAHRSGRMTLASIRESPGLDAYLDELEERLAEAVETHPGLVSEVGAEALAAGGKRLRPLLVFLCSPRPRAAGRGRPGRRARAHGDARPRRPDRPRRVPARPRRRLVEPRRRSARATGDYLFARAFAELAATGDARAVACSRTRRSAWPAARRSSGARRTIPDTTVESYLERCALKTGKLFEAACLLGAGGDRELGEFGARARDRLPDRRRHPRLLGRDGRDGQDRRHRPARGHADAAAAAGRARGRGRAPRAGRRSPRRRPRPGRRHGRARVLARNRARTTPAAPGRA